MKKQKGAFLTISVEPLKSNWEGVGWGSQVVWLLKRLKLGCVTSQKEWSCANSVTSQNDEAIKESEELEKPSCMTCQKKPVKCSKRGLDLCALEKWWKLLSLTDKFTDFCGFRIRKFYFFLHDIFKDNHGQCVYCWWYRAVKLKPQNLNNLSKSQWSPSVTQVLQSGQTVSKYKYLHVKSLISFLFTSF